MTRYHTILTTLRYHVDTRPFLQYRMIPVRDLDYDISASGQATAAPAIIYLSFMRFFSWLHVRCGGRAALVLLLLYVFLTYL